MARERIQPSNVCFVLDWETEASNNIFFQVCKENTADVRMANVSGKADVLEPKNWGWWWARSLGRHAGTGCTINRPDQHFVKGLSESIHVGTRKMVNYA